MVKVKYYSSAVLIVLQMFSLQANSQELPKNFEGASLTESNEMSHDGEASLGGKTLENKSSASNEVEVVPLEKVFVPILEGDASERWLNGVVATDVGTQFSDLPLPKGVEIFRRAEAVMLISVPFAIFYTFLVKSSFSYISAMGSGMEGGGTSVLPQKFAYSHDYFLKQTTDPFYVFTWVNNVIWPLTIALNNIMDRNTSETYVKQKKKNIPKNRFGDDLLLLQF